MGAISLMHTPEKGWHVSPKSEAKKPHFAAAIKNAKVNGKPLLQHLNDHWGDPSGGKHLPNVTTDSTDLHPMHAYLKDHDVDVIHVKSHGTFRGGNSEHKDRTGIGLPTPEGTGRFTLGRERAGGTVNGAFRPHKANFKKSHISLDNDDHIEMIKKKLGHTDENV